jgi:putative DNA primase/helicase
MREDPWTFDPTHSLHLMTNHLPQVDGRDEGIWRRVVLLPWEADIPRRDQNPNLLAELRDEASGVLAWVVEGARMALADGGRVDLPESVLHATAEYRTEEDTVARFIRDVGARAGPSEVAGSKLKLEHDLWCDENGIYRTNAHFQRVCAYLKDEVGVEKGRDSTPQRRSVWRGLQLGAGSEDGPQQCMEAY